MILRPDQEFFLSLIRDGFRAGYRRVLAVAPTGFGKTVCFSYMAAHARGKVGIVAHRIELIDQIQATLAAWGARAEVFSVWSRRPHGPFDFLIVDEAHHAAHGTSWHKVIAANPDAHVLGVTATPCRLSGEGLRASFQTLIEGPTTAELIQAGHLARYRYYAPTLIQTAGIRSVRGDFASAALAAASDRAHVTGDAVAHYQKLAPGRRALAFCVSVQHAHHVAEHFKSAGIQAAALDGTLSGETRASRVAGFKAGRIQVLTSCELVSEGFDLPAIEAAILLRPTQSLALYLQQVGRALRQHPGKTEAIILDHAGNALRHGLPDDPRAWSLAGIDRKPRNEPGVRECPACYAALPPATLVCTYCQKPLPPKPRTVEEVKGELEEVKRVERLSAQQERKAAATLEQLQAIERARGYRPGWARHVWSARGQRGRV